MKTYQKPEMNLFLLADEDILKTSVGCGDSVIELGELYF